MGEAQMGNQAGKVDKKERNKLIKSISDRNWTKEELEQLAVDFQKSDADGSGELDLAEFKALMKTKMPMTDAQYDNLFALFDADNSGTVSFKELASSLSVAGKGSLEDKLSFAFDLYDADKSGDIDSEELKEVITQMKLTAEILGRTGTDDFIEAIVTKLDSDGDS